MFRSYYSFSKKILKRQFLVKTFFGFLLVLGLTSFQDYGYTRDEVINRWRGIVTANYIGNLLDIDFLKSVDPLKLEVRNNFLQLTPTEAEHGALFETISAIGEKIIFSDIGVDVQKIYFFRHILIFLVYVGGVYAVYRMVMQRYTDWRLGLLAAGMLVISPRIYGNAFFNSNDIVFLSVFALAAHGAVQFLLYQHWKKVISGGVWAGAAIATRNLGVLIPLAVVVVSVISVLKEVSVRDFTFTKIVRLLAYLFITLIATIVCWPWLWEDPLARLFQSFAVMSKIPFEMQVLYFGDVISTFAIPWHYAPVWVGISTPLLYLALFFVGTFIVLQNLLISRWRVWSNVGELQDLFYLGLFLAPLLAVALFRSPIYDSWRHLFFIYPFLILIALRGWVGIWSVVKHHSVMRICALVAIALSLLLNCAWMIKAHPFESFYFNTLAGKDWKSQFDVDYWSLGVRRALEFIVRHDNRPFVRVGSVSVMTDFGALQIMDPAERARVLGVNSDLIADYMIQIYRTNDQDLAKFDSRYKLFHEIKIGDETVLTIYQNQDQMTLSGLALNERVDFSNAGKGMHYLLGIGISDRLGSSWHHPEPWGVWAATEEASVAIPLVSKGSKKLVLELIGAPQEGGKAQKVKIDIGDHFAQEVALDSKKSTLISIPLKSIQLKSNYIQIKFKVIESSKTFKNNSLRDERWLGVGLISARYE